MTHYGAVVVGAGPGGLTAIASLLDADVERVLWVDKTFRGGRLNENYREISSNTKVGIYLDAIHSSKTCTNILEKAQKPNAMTELEKIDREKTCTLDIPGDVLKLLTRGVLDGGRVEKSVGEVNEARFDEKAQIWNVNLKSSENDQISTPRLVLATGSHPTPASFHEKYNNSLKVLDLDECMLKSKLPSILPAGEQCTIAVIGNSHSGILVCRNLYELAEKDRNIKIYNFRRHGIIYAEYRDDGIVHDNSGLKGATADWAKETLETKPDSSIIEQVDLCSDEDEDEKRGDEVYKRYLPKCTHVVYAIGYQPNPLPRIYLDNRRIDEEMEFDMKTSGFRIKGSNDDKSARGLVKGLFGCGIAFPEKVKDPEGNIEAAVGVAKFFKFAERVKDDWLAVR